MTNHHNAAHEVLTASTNWINHFNAARVDACVETYLPDAVMNAQPIGSFSGREAILGFWKPFVESGAGELAYTNVQLRVEAADRVRLAADWTMNVGAGVITNELWVRTGDVWCLAEDEFEIKERFAA